MTSLALVALLAVARPGQDPPRQDQAPVGRAAVQALVYPPLVFDPPRVDEHEVEDVPVFHLHDPSLPLVDVHLQIRGGMAHFPRERMAALSALPALMRSGGTLRLPPDSVERRLDLLATEISFTSGGGGMAVSLNGLTPTVAEGLLLLREILLEPRFDAGAVETWRGQELDRVLRRESDPGGLAISAFNHLMYGDHPIGWVTGPEDFAPDRLTLERLREAHGAVVCREHLILGFAGDLDWRAAERLAREFLEPWPSCESRLTEPAPAELREGRAVFVLPRVLEQSTIIVAGPGGVLQDDSPDYFASRIADYVLGGAGLSSRLVGRLRTQEGLAYFAYSLWTASPRSEGLAGAVTASGVGRTVEAARLLIESLEGIRDEPPTPAEVEGARAEIQGGYVFAFESASQVVARRMAYRSAGFPEDWLERYLEGVGEVTSAAVARVTREHLDVAPMTILVVGDPDRFDPGLGEFGPVFILDPDGSYEPWAQSPYGPGGPR